MSLQREISEIFDLVSKQKSKDEAIVVLRNNDSNQLRQFLIYAFNPEIKFFVDKFPEKEYNPTKESLIPGNAACSIRSELNRCYLFRLDEPRSKHLSNEKRLELLLQSINEMSHKEARLFVDMLSKKVKIKNVNYKLINEVYPGLLPQGN